MYVKHFFTVISLLYIEIHAPLLNNQLNKNFDGKFSNRTSIQTEPNVR